MSDFQVTDELDKPVESIKIDPKHPSSLVKYCKDEILHLAVFPEFLERKDLILSKAAPKPIQFSGKAVHEFSVGSKMPSITVTPEVSACIRVNANPKTNLFGNDPFRAATKSPDATGYCSVGFEGTFEVAASGSSGDFSFGFDNSSGVSFEYLKAFPLGAGEPTLGCALGETMSCFVIPAALADVEALGINDIATVSGHGSLKVSGGIKVSATPNPLASASLPLGAGTVSVKAGATAGISASFTITGSYQVRVQRKDADTYELGVYRESGTAWKADISASGGVTATAASKNIVTTVMDAISTDPMGEKKLYEDLRPAELDKLRDAIKGGVDHSLQACVDLALSGASDDQAAFQYVFEPARMSEDSRIAVEQALSGDLRQLTLMEDTMEQGGKLADGLTMLNSVLTETRKRGVTLKINLIGILNYLTVSELVRRSEVLTDGVSGDVTIKETVSGNSITALSDPAERSEALRKAIFESVVATTTYKAGKAVSLPELHCEQMHFAVDRHADDVTFGNYLRWMVALDLMSKTECQAAVGKFQKGGTSTCVLRTSFGDHECTAMFLDSANTLRRKEYYLDFGRQAMRAMLDPEHQAIDKLRYRIVDEGLWREALIDTGASNGLAGLVGIHPDDPNVVVLIGDVKRITDWADAMVKVGESVAEMRALVGDADPAALVKNEAFNNGRSDLQKKIARLLADSKERFDTPWGMVCLYWAGGSPPTAYGKAVGGGMSIERGSKPAMVTAGAGQS